MSALELVRIDPREAQPLRDIRLEALALHPEAFSRDVDVERKLSVEDWKATIVRHAWFVCRKGNEWRGIAAFSRDLASVKTSHIGSLGSMYVRDKFRGQGVGDMLVAGALSHARQEVEQVVLTVNAENRPAILLYERHGFRTYGRMPRSIRLGERYYDELEMICLFSPDA